MSFRDGANGGIENSDYNLDYDNNGNLIKLKDVCDGDISSITYNMDVIYKGNAILYHTLYGVQYQEPIEELGLIGMLGKPSNNLPVQQVLHESSSTICYSYSWTIDDQGYPLNLIVNDGEANDDYWSFTWEE